MDTQLGSTLQSILQAFRQEVQLDKVLTALTVLQKLCINVIEHPEEAKYRSFKKSNPAISKKLLISSKIDAVLGIIGFHEKDDIYNLDQKEIDCLVSGMPIIIFERRLMEAKKQGQQAYKQELQIIKRQKLNSKKQMDQALAKKQLNKNLQYDKKQRLKMQISYAQSRPLGFQQDRAKEKQKQKKQQSSSKFIFYVTKSDQFQKQILPSKTPIIMDFYADWCPPCKQLLPLLQAKVASDNGKWHLYKINSDNKDVAGLCQKFKLKGIPHLVVIKGGKIKYSKAGGMGPRDLDMLVQDFIDNDQ